MAPGGRSRGRGTTASFFRLREAAGLPFLRTTQKSPGTDAVPENSLVPISDEQAKLGQEALKVLRGLGSFLQMAEELGISRDEVEVSLANLRRVELAFEPQGNLIAITALGREFLRAVAD
jgi:hypothetical protein